MKRLLPQIVSLAILCTGCLFLFGESFAYKDSIANASGTTCSIIPSFDYGFTAEQSKRYSRFVRDPGEKRVIQPESNLGFTVLGRGLPVPSLTNILVETWTSPSKSYSLNADELLRLRNAAGGEVHLILYDEGLACEPPAYREEFVAAKSHVPFNKADYYRRLRSMRQPAIEWTREVLGRP